MTNTTDGVMGMGDAPERIWAAPDTDYGWRWPVASKFPMQGYATDGQVTYVLSDTLAKTLAANATLLKRLEEARWLLSAWHRMDNEGTTSDYPAVANGTRAFLAGGD